MKCPWRTIETQMTNEPYMENGSEITVQESRISFDECYGGECPFWEGFGLTYHCKRTDELIVED